MRYSTRSFTVTYTDLFAMGTLTQPWNYRVSGVPNAENLAREVKRFLGTFQPGGCNEHIAQQRSVMIVGAVVTDTKGNPYATWKGVEALLQDPSDYEQDPVHYPDPKHLVDAGVHAGNWGDRPWTCRDAILPYDYFNPRRNYGIPLPSLANYASEGWKYTFGWEALPPNETTLGDDSGDLPSGGESTFAPLPDHLRM